MRMVLLEWVAERLAGIEGSAGRFTGTNPGVADCTSLFRARLIQRLTRLALRSLSKAMRATETPGCWHCATIWALNSREKRRRVRVGLITLNELMDSVHWKISGHYPDGYGDSLKTGSPDAYLLNGSLHNITLTMTIWVLA